MLNVLIIGKNFIRCKEIINEITQLRLNLKIHKIASSKSEVLKILKYDKIDVIIININIIEELQIIKEVEEYDKIIISSKQEIIDILNKMNYQNIFRNIKDNTEVQYLLCNMVMKNNELEKGIKDKINKELKYLHFNFSHKGTIFLRECIYLIYIKSNKKINLNKEIYTNIARKYNSSINTIKCDIFQACCNSYYESEEEIMKEYLNMPCIEKPTTKDFIEAIIKRI